MKFPYVVSMFFFVVAWLVFLAMENKTLEQYALSFINLGLAWFVAGVITGKEEK